MRGDLSPILAKFGSWAVTTYGLECTDRYYPIDREQLCDPDWADHMVKKYWCHMGDFQDALAAAIQYHYRQRVPRNKRVRVVDVKQRYRVMLRDDFRCQLCGATAEDGVKMHVDHIEARSRGGSNDDNNLRTLCQNCNLGKSDL